MGDNLSIVQHADGTPSFMSVSELLDELSERPELFAESNKELSARERRNIMLRELETTIQRTFLAVNRDILDVAQKYFNASEFLHAHPPRFFALFAANLNLLPSGKALVCDIEIHPPLLVRGARDHEAKLTLLRDVLQLAGVPTDGEALVHARPIAELEAFCSHERCDTLAREQLAQLLDEEARIGAFRRLIPDAQL